MELSQRMDNLESQNLSNIILHTNNNENNTYLKNDIPGLPMNTISDLNAFNQKLSEDEIFCNNVVSKQYTYIVQMCLECLNSTEIHNIQYMLITEVIVYS